MDARSFRGLFKTLAVLAPVVLLSNLIVATPVHAFAPFTHEDTAMPARADAIDNGKVTIAGREYPVNAAVVTAIRDFPTYYRAGVIGPDGFPDLVMGQGVVHPHDTGRWLSYLLKHAWDAQDDSLNNPPYNSAEKSQILAFTYGYLTHAAGDMWAHTLVNQFTGGPFPNLGANLLTNPGDLSNAIRHELVEFYMADATPGFDGNRIDNRKVLPDGDISDESTPANPIDVPVRFVFETLVRHTADEPSPDRGFLLAFFFGLRATLQAAVVPPLVGKSLQQFADDFNNLKAQFDALGTGPCDFGDDDVLDFAEDIGACPLALLELGFNIAITGLADFTNLVTSALHDALTFLYNAYLQAWIDDIDSGLKHWPELGLAISRGLFDPQARRNLQNDPGADGCGSIGPDSLDIASARGSCEDKISTLGTVLHETEAFRNDHLLSMLGAPDLVGDALTALSQAADLLSAILGPIANPLRETKAQITEAVKSLVEDFIKDRYGIDIPAFEAFIKSPSSKMDVTSLVVLTPAGNLTLPLFKPTDHALLDHYLGIPDPHATSLGGTLGDAVTYDPTKFAAWQDTVTMAKLILLDGPALDSVMSDLVGHPVQLYAGVPNANIMTTPLSGVPNSELIEPAKKDEWLRLIDGDHAWRKDGLPVFTDLTRFEGPSGGNGNFPLWKSCVLRTPVFRTLFKDWENESFVPTSPDDSANFPNYGDLVASDPNDPNPPSSTLTTVGTTYSNGGTTYVNKQTGLTIQAHDGFWSDSEVTIDATITGPAGIQFSGTLTNGSTVHLTGPDGAYQVVFGSHDPCGIEANHTHAFVLDSTAPVVTFTEPAQAEYTTDQTASIQYTVSDDTQGSGVASNSVTLDGAAAVNGQVLDMFTLDPGLHSIVVTATDNVGNSGTTTRTFNVKATAGSLLSNLDRAQGLGLVTNNGAYNGLRAKLLAAQAAHDRGQHATEWNILAAFINQVLAKSGNGIDPATATRLIEYAQYIIDTKG